MSCPLEKHYDADVHEALARPACLMALNFPTKLGSLSITLQIKASQNVGSKEVLQINPSGINYFDYFYYFDDFYYFHYFNILYFSFRWLLCCVLDKAL